MLILFLLKLLFEILVKLFYIVLIYLFSTMTAIDQLHSKIRVLNHVELLI